MTLNEIDSISWDAYVVDGYAPHVDVFLDNGKTLVFEYAKVDPTDCDDAADYPDGAVNTFDDKGIINDNARAWLTSGDAGCGNDDYDCPGFIDGLLSQWKVETADDSTINGNTPVLRLEIEVDGWIPTIAESEAFIDDVYVNEILVEDFEGTQTGTGQIVPDLTLTPNPNPLDFGNIFPGQSKTLPATLTAGYSNIIVNGVSVTPIIGTVFDDANVLFSKDAGANFVFASTIAPINNLSKIELVGCLVSQPANVPIPVNISSETTHAKK